mmetsp:Transcript_27246/g.109092  ORF Transcript_27246/g.109092 Transcript_27246/m.109092 type:complete len:365 (-) Transcript_27246:860-1954(-)
MTLRHGDHPIGGGGAWEIHTSLEARLPPRRARVVVEDGAVEASHEAPLGVAVVVERLVRALGGVVALAAARDADVEGVRGARLEREAPEAHVAALGPRPPAHVELADLLERRVQRLVARARVQVPMHAAEVVDEPAGRSVLLLCDGTRQCQRRTHPPGADDDAPAAVGLDDARGVAALVEVMQCERVVVDVDGGVAVGGVVAREDVPLALPLRRRVAGAQLREVDVSMGIEVVGPDLLVRDAVVLGAEVHHEEPRLRRALALRRIGGVAAALLGRHEHDVRVVEADREVGEGVEPLRRGEVPARNLVEEAAAVVRAVGAAEDAHERFAGELEACAGDAAPSRDCIILRVSNGRTSVMSNNTTTC